MSPEPRTNSIGTYHAHPDILPDDPEMESHKPKIGSLGGLDLSKYLPPSYRSDPHDARKNDIDEAKRQGKPGIAVDRYYTYIYQGDGRVWVFPHPSVISGGPPPPVLDRPYHPKDLPGKLREKALGGAK